MKGARHPKLRDGEALLAVDAVAVEVHFPFAGVVDTGHDVEHRGFSGAVRADKREDLTFVNGELHVVHGDHAAEPHRYASEFEDGGSVAGCGGHGVLTCSARSQ